MADARTKFQLGDSVSPPKSKEVIGFGKRQGTLPIPCFPPRPIEKPALLDRAGFRAFQQSPSKLTDGIPSASDYSSASPNVAAETDLIGLGISGVDAIDVDEPDPKSELKVWASKHEDLMDMDVPDAVSDTLVPESSSQEEMVSIPKHEADMWKTIYSLLDMEDAAGVQRYFTKVRPVLHTVEETVHPTSHAAEIKASVVQKLEDLIGDRNLPIRSSASQTTPSLELGKSKWAAPTTKLYPVAEEASGKALRAPNPETVTGSEFTPLNIPDDVHNISFIKTDFSHRSTNQLTRC